jgi:hypothetical protein
VINEIQYNPNGADENQEWVELYNAGDAAVDLSGWYLADNDGYTFDLSGAGSLPAGGYLICHLNDTGTNSSTDVYGPLVGQVVIQPDGTGGMDNFLDVSAPNNNWDGLSFLWVLNAVSQRRPIIQFDLSEIPTGNIEESTVWLYRESGSATDTTVKVHRITQWWMEAFSTWNERIMAFFPWITPGGDYDGTSEDSVVVKGGIDDWYSWDITALTKAWVGGTYTNYGLIFVADSGGDSQFFTSSDSADADYRPKLIVNLTSGSMLENSDDLALVNHDDTIWDYVAWGADAGSDDDEASLRNQWTDGEYVDTSLFSENETLGRDLSSNDTDMPADWEDATGFADPYGIDRSSENESSPGAQNVDFVIFEFSDITVPMVFTSIIFAVWRRKSRRRK